MASSVDDDDAEEKEVEKSAQEDDKRTVDDFKDNWAIKLLAFRFHFIPPMIFLSFIIMMVLCYYHAPTQYREVKVFQISNLGNWGSGISFFSSSMVVIAWFMYQLTSELIRQRVLKDYHQKKLTRYGPMLYKLGSLVLFFGLIITGCYQQSHNKPAHNIGVLAMAVGFGLILYYDMLHLWFSNKEKSTFYHKIAAVVQVVLVILVVIFGVGFVVLLGLAKYAWNQGEEEALAKRNLTECPEWGVDEALSGSVYPFFYPCKSQTLWLHDDPGWDLFKYSSLLEVLMFLAVTAYPLTYLWQMERELKLPAWLIPVLYRHVGLKSNKKSKKTAEVAV
ncbi:hypothetical protein ACHWQZ_G009935 [Mnemiopsis leidyi]